MLTILVQVTSNLLLQLKSQNDRVRDAEQGMAIHLLKWSVDTMKRYGMNLQIIQELVSLVFEGDGGNAEAYDRCVRELWRKMTWNNADPGPNVIHINVGTIEDGAEASMSPPQGQTPNSMLN